MALRANMIPRATPTPAPTHKPRTLMLLIEAVPLPANRKPANAIHRVQRTRRMFIRVPPDYE